MKEIIVISDGSTDETVNKVRALNSPKVKLIVCKNRLGKSTRLNQICRRFKGDLLFLADADIVVNNMFLFADIIKNIDFSKHGLVSLNSTPLPPQTFFESCITFSSLIHTYLRKRWNNGSNYLAFKGCFLGLSASFARNLTVETRLINQDAYIYFNAMEQGYSPIYYGHKKVFYRAPTTFSDHLNQSSRHQMSWSEIKQLSAIEKKAYAVPTLLLLETILLFLLLNPIYMCIYAVIFYLTLWRHITFNYGYWDTVLSTKNTNL